jgi:signal peptidase I
MCLRPALPKTRDSWEVSEPAAVAEVDTKSGKEFWLKQAGLLIWITLLSLLGYHLISHYVITVVEVQGRSMAPTLQDGDRYFLNRIVFYWRAPARGDLVVVRDPGHNDCAVKRIIALPGDSMAIRDGIVFLNGRRLAEPYLSRDAKTFAEDKKEKSLVLGEDRYFLLGDNRVYSEDSRAYGPVHRNQIVGLISK